MAGFKFGSSEWLGSLFDEGFGCAFIFEDGRQAPGINPLKPPAPVDEQDPLHDIVAAQIEVGQGIDFLRQAYTTVRKKSLLPELKADVNKLMDAINEFESAL